MTGFESKREAVADKLLEEATRSCNNIDEQRALDALMREAQPAQEPWNEDEWRRNNWRCGHGWLRGEQCESCNAPQPPSEWAGIKAILDEYGLQAIDFVADFKTALAQPTQEPVEYQMRILGNRWTHCAAHLYDEKNPNTRALYTIPPQREWVGLTDDEIKTIVANYCLTIGNWSLNGLSVAQAVAAKLKDRNT